MILFKALIKVKYHPIKKNGKEIRRNFKTGGLFLDSNQRAKDGEEFLYLTFLQERIKKQIKTINQKVNAKMVFFYPKSEYYTKKGEESKTIADLSNLYQSVEDSLQKSKVLENDRLIRGQDGSDVLPSKDENHYLYIEITPKESKEFIWPDQSL